MTSTSKIRGKTLKADKPVRRKKKTGAALVKRAAKAIRNKKARGKK